MRAEERIEKGILFCPGDPELKAIKLRSHNLSCEYNRTFEDETEKRAAILEAEGEKDTSVHHEDREHGT